MSLEKMLSNASESICSDSVSELPIDTPVYAELMNFLRNRNGFYMLEGALLVRPSCGTAGQDVASIQQWNDPDLWINEYGDLAKDALFFAEDIFGVQFCIRHNEIATFDPETAKFETIAGSLEEWGEKVISDYNQLTGFSIGRDWQQQNGELKKGFRLLPKIPFVLGGKFSVDNLVAYPDFKGMRYRADIANQILEMPDGASIKLKVID